MEEGVDGVRVVSIVRVETVRVAHIRIVARVVTIVVRRIGFVFRILHVQVKAMQGRPVLEREGQAERDLAGVRVDQQFVMGAFQCHAPDQMRDRRRGAQHAFVKAGYYLTAFQAEIATPCIKGSWPKLLTSKR